MTKVIYHRAAIWKAGKCDKCDLPTQRVFLRRHRDILRKKERATQWWREPRAGKSPREESGKGTIQATKRPPVAKPKRANHRANKAAKEKEGKHLKESNGSL